MESLSGSAREDNPLRADRCETPAGNRNPVAKHARSGRDQMSGSLASSRCRLGGHINPRPFKTRSMACEEFTDPPAARSSKGRYRSGRTSRSIITGLRTAAPRTMVQATRSKVVLPAMVEKSVVEVPPDRARIPVITTMVTLLRYSGSVWRKFRAVDQCIIAADAAQSEANKVVGVRHLDIGKIDDEDGGRHPAQTLPSQRTMSTDRPWRGCLGHR